MRGMDSIQLTQVGACLRGQDITPTANSTIIIIFQTRTLRTFSQCSPIAPTILGQQQSHRSGSHPGARSYMGQCKKVTVVLMLITSRSIQNVIYKYVVTWLLRWHFSLTGVESNSHGQIFLSTWTVSQVPRCNSNSTSRQR